MPGEIHHDDLAARTGKAGNRHILALWEACPKSDGGIPSYVDFNLNSVGALRESCLVVEPDGEADWYYVFYGADLARNAKIDMTGRRLSELDGGAAEALRAAYARAMTELRPLLLTHGAMFSQSVHTWERVILPVRGPKGVMLVSQALPLLLRQDLLEAILRSGPVPMFSGAPVFGPDGGLADITILLANQSAGQLFEREFCPSRSVRISELVGNLAEMDLLDFCNLVLVHGTPSRLEAKCRIGERESDYEIGISRFDGGLTLTFADLGELRRAYNALERQQAELVAVNRTLERQKAELAALAEEMQTARKALDEEIAQRNALESELRRLASVDDLTGTMNRRAFLEIVHREVARSDRYGNPVAIAILDLDRFKAINDTYGHGVGDEVLREAAGILASTTRVGIDEIGRLGGEEFGVLLPETTLDGGRMAAERMRAALAEMAIEVDGRPVPVQASFGVAVWEPGYGTVEAWMGAADMALYRAKEAGRNRVETTGPDDTAEAAGRAA